MAATTADGNKVAVGETTNVREVVGEKSSNIGGEVVAEERKVVELVSSDGDRFEITHEAAAMSQTIQHMIEDDRVENGIPLPNVNSKTLAKVIEYCNKHVAATTSDGEKEDLRSFDENFVKLDQATLLDIISAAYYLDIYGLLDISCQTVAGMMKGKTVEDMRTFFNVKNDFTPEEEEEMRNKNPWAFK